MHSESAFCCAQPPKWRAQTRTLPQIAVFVSEVVIAKGTSTLFEVVSSFSEKLFCLCLFFRGCVHAKLQPQEVAVIYSNCTYDLP